MQLPPLEVIAAWPKPNYENAPTRGPANIILNSVLFPIAFGIVGIRVYTRLCLSKCFGIDDWFMLLALLPTAAFSTTALVIELHLGFNKHIWDIHLTDLAMLSLGLKLVMTVQIMFGLASTLIKLSMLALTYRIFTSASSRLRPWIIAAFVLVALGGLIFAGVVALQCAPKVSQYWTFSATPQKCIDEKKHLLAAGIINTITDLIVVTLPIPTVLGVRMPLHQMTIIVLLFAAGFIATAAGAVRTYYTYKITTSYDRTWDAFLTWLTSDIELYLGIICASLPPTKKFFSRYLPYLIPTSIYSRSTRTASSHPTYSGAANPSHSSTSQHQDIELSSAFRKDSEEKYGNIEESIVKQTTSVDKDGSFESEVRATSSYGHGSRFTGMSMESTDELVND